MHFEILVEDQSGKKALEIIVPKIIGVEDSFKVYSYKGIGRIPKNLAAGGNPSGRLLLDRLPKVLRGYGRTFSRYPKDYNATVIVVCDLDDKCKKIFLAKLKEILDSCDPKPQTRFCLAIEEGEAWFLGDMPAIKRAYPEAKEPILSGYLNDSICGTWELLANAVFRGGYKELRKKGWQAIGAEKSAWAEKISPHMNVNNNRSPALSISAINLSDLSAATLESSSQYLQRIDRVASDTPPS